MKEIVGDLWEQECDALCITTNGYVKKDGRAVMGAGTAKQALMRVRDIDVTLGRAIHKHGNVPHILTKGVPNIVSFPVKPRSGVYSVGNCVTHMMGKFRVGQVIPGWACVASIELIEVSCIALVEMTDEQGWERVVLPRPGCGAGELTWKYVRERIAPLLDDRFCVVEWGGY